jgi:hypothetical protein
MDLSYPDVRVRDLVRNCPDSWVIDVPIDELRQTGQRSKDVGGAVPAYNRHVGKACQTDPKRLERAACSRCGTPRRPARH